MELLILFLLEFKWMGANPGLVGERMDRVDRVGQWSIFLILKFNFDTRLFFRIGPVYNNNVKCSRI